MSRKYATCAGVPTESLCNRLDELAKASICLFTNDEKTGKEEFRIRIPAEPDHDADLVLIEAARRLREKDYD